MFECIFPKNTTYNLMGPFLLKKEIITTEYAKGKYSSSENRVLDVFQIFMAKR